MIDQITFLVPSTKYETQNTKQTHQLPVALKIWKPITRIKIEDRLPYLKCEREIILPTSADDFSYILGAIWMCVTPLDVVLSQNSLRNTPVVSWLLFSTS